MGIEQILMPILGGVASGVGRGLEEKRQQQQEAERQRNANMAAKFMKDPELFEDPMFRKWAQNYWGKDEAKAMYSSARIQRLQRDYLMEERARTGNMNPEPLSPDQIPPEPVFADFSGGGENQGRIAGLISRFVPGAGAVMNTLGGLVGPGAAQAQMTPQVSSPTGPASGPQGYPPPGGWQQAGAPATPQAGQVVGYLQSGRPVVQNADGSTSTHRNMIAGFGDKFYIVPTIYGGKEVTPDQAAQIARQNNLTDPDTGQKLVGYPTQQAAEQAEKSLHAQLEKEPRVPLTATSARVGMDQRIGMGAVSRIPVTTAVATPGGGATLTIAGTPPPPGTRSAFTRRRPMKPAPGVTASYNKDGDLTVKIAHVDDNLSQNMNEVSRRLIDARRPEDQKLDMNNADDLAEVLDYANELTLKVLSSKNALTEEQKLRALESPRNLRAQGALARTKAEGGAEGAYNIASRSDVVMFENQQKFNAALNTAQGTGAAENSIAVGPDGKPLVFDAQGNPMTLSQIRAAREVETTQRKEQATVLDTVTQKKLDGMKGMLASVDRIWQNYDPKFLGAIQGTSKALKWREITGLASGPESVMRQTMTALSNIKIQDLTGAGVTHEDGVRILAELPSPQDSPDVFVAKLANFQTMLGEALERVQQGATEPRSAQTPTTGRTGTQEPVVAPQVTINKKTGKPFNPNVPGRTAPVAPMDNTATDAPSPAKTYEVNQSSLATPALRKEMKKQIDQMVKDGLLDPNAQMIVIPDSAAIPGERIQ